MKNNETILKNIGINAPVARVWNAFTDPQLTKQYFFDCELHSGFKVGDEISFTLDKDHDKIVCVKGIITHCQPEKLLAYTCFSPATANQKDKHTLVTIALVSDGDKTQLTITQGSFGNDKLRYDESNEGWNFVLSGLKQLLETT